MRLAAWWWSPDAAAGAEGDPADTAVTRSCSHPGSISCPDYSVVKTTMGSAGGTEELSSSNTRMRRTDGRAGTAARGDTRPTARDPPTPHTVNSQLNSTFCLRVAVHSKPLETVGATTRNDSGVQVKRSPLPCPPTPFTRATVVPAEGEI
ncbi:hypothetical protein E2C01_004794 [Portunus trituberculatus]|uniref:Uncharacterized protein n=1 Tax=Portunus trituberculatus TaxID=210409 RepID=A0A5B7CUV7_PORTR|nr:hypothetical protein [Portunus trituberculatus]